jgi:hypothetical protein
MNKKYLIIILVLDAIIVAGLMYYFVNEYYLSADEPTSLSPSETKSVETPAVEPAVPAPAQGKINPQVACESALMYTTFTDSAAADAFVADCVAGEHPEVIERYINEMGVGGARI